MNREWIKIMSLQKLMKNGKVGILRSREVKEIYL